MNIINEIEDFLGLAKKDIHDEIFCVLTGQFSSGKSRFMNKLIGQDYLPVGTREMTAVPTYIKNGEDMSLIYKGSDYVKSSLSEVKNIKKGKCDCSKIELYVSSLYIPSDMIFIDTPGTNSVSLCKCDNEFYKADVVFYFLIKCISAYDVQLIDDICTNKNIKLIFIRTRIDDIKESEENISVTYLEERELVKSIYPDSDFFFVSLETDECSQNQISELMSYVRYNLKDEIEKRRKLYIKDYIDSTLMPMLLNTNYKLQIQSSDSSLIESEKRIKKYLKNIKKNFESREEFIRDEIWIAKNNYYKSGCVFVDKSLKEKDSITCIEIQTYVSKCMEKLEKWYELELNDIVSCISGVEKIPDNMNLLISDETLHEIFIRHEGKKIRYSNFIIIEQNYIEKMNEFIETSKAKAYMKKIFESIFIKIDANFFDSYTNMINSIIEQLDEQYKIISKYFSNEPENIKKVTDYILELKKYEHEQEIV